MRAVENAHLQRAIRRKCRYPLHIHTKGGKGQARVLFPFNDPKVEGLAGIHKVVLVAKLDGFAGCTRYDTVNQRVSEGAFLGHKAAEILAKPPVGGVTENDLPQSIAVVLDQLARKHEKSRQSRRKAEI